MGLRPYSLMLIRVLGCLWLSSDIYDVSYRSLCISYTMSIMSSTIYMPYTLITPMPIYTVTTIYVTTTIYTVTSTTYVNKFPLQGAVSATGIFLGTNRALLIPCIYEPIMIYLKWLCYRLPLSVSDLIGMSMNNSLIGSKVLPCRIEVSVVSIGIFDS